MIRFSKPSIGNLEERYVLDALKSLPLSGDGKYTEMAVRFFKERLHIPHILLTTSGTSALEMASVLLCLEPGDEVIVPSYTFSSTVNAFMLRGAKPVFCDIRTDTLNLDETLIEGLITPKTKAIFTVDYAGVPCEADTILNIANKYCISVVEDAAQAVGSMYKGRPAGTLGDIGCYSFHDTKNYVMGEGGAVILNDDKLVERAEIIREKGTNRRQLQLGLVDKYTWHDIGSSYLPSEILSALLCAQLERFDEIMSKRMDIWNLYHKKFEELENNGYLSRPVIPENCLHNAHMYYLILNGYEVRNKLINYMKHSGVLAVFHYIPLHSAPMGVKLGYNASMLPKTEEYSSRLLRLPLYPDMSLGEVETVISLLYDFFNKN